ncbi:MAG: DGQHR domain-containing protein [Candidatus Aenigmarchaeota archaeon]|nr:DGQHR domain-containing protein [Candidatus Aenigmarchaeota archaeon]
MPRRQQTPTTNIDPEWKKFEKFVRDVFIKVNFEDTIMRDDSWYRLPSGNQIDVFGGADKIAIVLDCATTNNPDGTRTLRDKINKTVQKKPGIEQAIDQKFDNKYTTKIFVICTKGINITDGDKTYAAQHQIKLIDCKFFEEARVFIKETPEQIKYQILKRLGQKIKFSSEDESFEPLLNQPTLKISSGDFVGYALVVPVSLLLRLAYVHRLEIDPIEGYQRKINIKKIIGINDFLMDSNNFFVNSILIALDQEPDISQIGVTHERIFNLKLPSEYASCEVIDGQHRLYGYVPLKKMTPEEKDVLRNRQNSDVLPIIAVVDREHKLRHRLFLDIDATQKPVDPIQIWTQYGKEHPEVERGYISNVLKKMDENGPLKDCIYKIGEAKQKKKIVTISFLGGVLEKTRLLNKEDTSSLVHRAFSSRKYPRDILSNDPSLKVLNDFLAAIQECSGINWPTGRYTTSLMKSSYGISIFLELFPYIKKQFEYQDLTLIKINFKKIFVKISDFLTETDNEGRVLWEKSTLTSAGTRRKALKHFVRKYLLTLPEWKDAQQFINIIK